MKKIIWLIVVLVLFESCRAPRGYETNTHQFIGYGTYKAPHKKGIDK